VTESFGTVVFVDAGDVTREKRWRFEYPQTSVGLGLRYHTFVGPLRFDVALAPEDWQHIGGGRDMRVRDVITDGMVRPIDESEVFGIDGLYGAVSFTIGEAF
jgi:outer membrane protein insertion porin family/translocation and assembly module TamA